MFFSKIVIKTMSWVGLALLVGLPVLPIPFIPGNSLASITDNATGSITIDVDNVTVNEILLRLYLKSGYWVRLGDEYKNRKVNFHVVDSNLKDSIKTLLKVVGIRNFALVMDEKSKEIVVFVTESDNSVVESKALEKKSEYVPTDHDLKHLPPQDLALPSMDDIGPVEPDTNIADYNIPPQDRLLPKPEDLGPSFLETNMELSSIPPQDRILPDPKDLGPVYVETDKSLANIPPQDRAMPTAAELGL